MITRSTPRKGFNIYCVVGREKTTPGCVVCIYIGPGVCAVHNERYREVYINGKDFLDHVTFSTVIWCFNLQPQWLVSSVSIIKLFRNPGSRRGGFLTVELPMCRE